MFTIVNPLIIVEIEYISSPEISRGPLRSDRNIDGMPRKYHLIFNDMPRIWSIYPENIAQIAQISAVYHQISPKMSPKGLIYGSIWWYVAHKICLKTDIFLQKIPVWAINILKNTSSGPKNTHKYHSFPKNEGIGGIFSPHNARIKLRPHNARRVSHTCNTCVTHTCTT